MKKKEEEFLQELKKSMRTNVGGETVRSYMRFIEQERTGMGKADIWSFVYCSDDAAMTRGSYVYYKDGCQIACGYGLCRVKKLYPQECEGMGIDKDGSENRYASSLNLTKMFEYWGAVKGTFSIDAESYIVAAKKAVAPKKECRDGKLEGVFYAIKDFAYEVSVFDSFVSMMPVIGAEKLYVSRKGDMVAVGTDGQFVQIRGVELYPSEKSGLDASPDGKYEDGCKYYIHVNIV